MKYLLIFITIIIRIYQIFFYQFFINIFISLINLDNKTQEIEMAMYTLASKTSEMRRGQEFMDVRDETHSRSNIYDKQLIWPPIL